GRACHRRLSAQVRRVVGARLDDPRRDRRHDGPARAALAVPIERGVTLSTPSGPSELALGALGQTRIADDEPVLVELELRGEVVVERRVADPPLAERLVALPGALDRE